MSDLLFHLQSGKVRNLEETVEVWQMAHAEALRALDAADLVRECLTFSPGLQVVWERAWQDATAGHIRDYQDVGLSLRGLFERTLNVLNRVQWWARNVARETGHPVEGLERLDQDIQGFQRQRDRIVENWPWEDRPWPPLNREMVAESRASSARGEGEDVSTLLDRARAGVPL